METVFNSSLLREQDRGRAWVEALNSTYVCLDSTLHCDSYSGFLKKVDYGDVSITDTSLSAQTISRRPEHIARLDKDCFYFQFLRHGATRVETAGRELKANPVTGALFSASEAYDLTCSDNTRSWWLEIERSALLERGAAEPTLTPGLFSLNDGLGRLAHDHMLSLVSVTTRVPPDTRLALGRGLIDLLVLALKDPDRQTLETDQTDIAQLRLSGVQASIRRDLSNPGLTPGDIAAGNGISVGYLHRLFRGTGMTVSEWIREERLRHSYALLTSAKGVGMTITDIAFASGFGSSSHFSTLFRARFGCAPKEVKATAGTSH